MPLSRDPLQTFEVTRKTSIRRMDQKLKESSFGYQSDRGTVRLKKVDRAVVLQPAKNSKCENRPPRFLRSRGHRGLDPGARAPGQGGAHPVTTPSALRPAGNDVMSARG